MEGMVTWHLDTHIQAFDHDFVEDTLARLRRLQNDAQPGDKSETVSAIVDHLAASLRYTMRRDVQRPVRCTWSARHLWRPLVLWGIVWVSPKFDVALPGEADAESDIETLHALFEEYLGMVQEGELAPPYHPILGDLGVDGWARFHVHHIRQHVHELSG